MGGLGQGAVTEFKWVWRARKGSLCSSFFERMLWTRGRMLWLT